MKKMQKWIALLLAVLMLSAIFAGCAKPTTTPEQGDTQQTETDTQGTETANQPAPQPQEGSDAAWDTSKNDEIIVTVINGYYTAGEKKLAEEYTKLHPETKVTVDVVSDNDAYMAKMQSLFSGDMTGSSDIVHANFLTNALGGNEVCFQKNYLRELSDVLDMQHPYQDGLVRDMYNDTILTEAWNAVLASVRCRLTRPVFPSTIIRPRLKRLDLKRRRPGKNCWKPARRCATTDTKTRSLSVRRLPGSLPLLQTQASAMKKANSLCSPATRSMTPRPCPQTTGLSLTTTTSPATPSP